MANGRFEMYEARQVLVRMRQGQSDRGISRARLMGRDKAQPMRGITEARGWLDPGRTLPDDGTLVEIFARAQGLSSPSLAGSLSRAGGIPGLGCRQGLLESQNLKQAELFGLSSRLPCWL
jgi:hypothetical protein